ELALELAVYLNSQPKRVNKSKTKIIPVQLLLEYFNNLLKASSSLTVVAVDSASEQACLANVVYLKPRKPNK
ncbi:MAG: hypothetical protein NWQ54_08635, partial [Paraglaciecola sp.]|nr:hypothetical protein [Paraglaciecola sp.]